jgi:hypothetical protein
MDISGKLIHILPAQTGTGKNGAWKKCDFVIETSDKYPKKVCITAWNEQADQIERTPLNSDLKVSFDISSREYNGRWYNDVKAWKIVVENAVTPAPPASDNSTPPDFPSIESADDLPF